MVRLLSSILMFSSEIWDSTCLDIFSDIPYKIAFDRVMLLFIKPAQKYILLESDPRRLKNKVNSHSYLLAKINSGVPFHLYGLKVSGPSCSKLTTSLVDDSLKLTSSDTQIC